MDRKPSRDLKRQLSYFDTMKKNAEAKHIAKIQAYNDKIEVVKLKLDEALAAEEADTLSAK